MNEWHETPAMRMVREQVEAELKELANVTMRDSSAPTWLSECPANQSDSPMRREP